MCNRILRIASFLIISSLSAMAESIDGFRQNSPQPLLASDGSEDDRFGVTVAIFGEVIAVGAPNCDTAATNAGAVYVYSVDETGMWQEETILYRRLGASEKWLGRSVAISGSTLFAGAAEEGTIVPNYCYVFERDDANKTWHEIVRLEPDPPNSNNRFGWSSAVVCDRAAVGAPLDSDHTILSGAVYVFERSPSDGMWQRVAKLKSDYPSINERFGYAVALSHSIIVIGAPDDNTVASRSGAAYIFEFDQIANAWLQRVKLTADDGGDFHRFGTTVAISGDNILVGAPGDDELGTNSGAAYAYRRTGPEGNWLFEQKIVAADTEARDLFAEAIAIDGNIAIIGAGFDQNNASRGSAHLFEYDTKQNMWVELATFFSPHNLPGGYFGRSVAISGTRMIVGAWGDMTLAMAAGAAFAFQGSCVKSLPGDLNCDRAVTVSDIGAFVLAVVNPNGYSVEFPDCFLCNADLNNDGEVTVSDIGDFITLIISKS